MNSGNSLLVTSCKKMFAATLRRGMKSPLLVTWLGRSCGLARKAETRSRTSWRVTGWLLSSRWVPCRIHCQTYPNITDQVVVFKISIAWCISSLFHIMIYSFRRTVGPVGIREGDQIFASAIIALAIISLQKIIIVRVRNITGLLVPGRVRITVRVRLIYWDWGWGKV